MGTPIPKRDAAALGWGENMIQGLLELAGELKLVPEEVAALEQAYAQYRDAVSRQRTQAAAAQSATAAKQEARQQFVTLCAGAMRRAKGSPAYSAVIGEKLGFVIPQKTPPAQQPGLRPGLRCRNDREGEVVIAFAKRRCTGVLLWTRRGEEMNWTLLSKQFASPLADPRPNLVPGVPELRYYCGQYVERDQPIGERGGVLVVTVEPRL